MRKREDTGQRIFPEGPWSGPRRLGLLPAGDREAAPNRKAWLVLGLHGRIPGARERWRPSELHVAPLLLQQCIFAA